MRKSSSTVNQGHTASRSRRRGSTVRQHAAGTFCTCMCPASCRPGTGAHGAPRATMQDCPTWQSPRACCTTRAVFGAAIALLVSAAALSWFAAYCGAARAAAKLFVAGHVLLALGVGSCAHVAWDVLIAASGGLSGALCAPRLLRPSCSMLGHQRMRAHACMLLRCMLWSLCMRAAARPHPHHAPRHHLRPVRSAAVPCHLCMGLGQRPGWAAAAAPAWGPSLAPPSRQSVGGAAVCERRAAGADEVGSGAERERAIAPRMQLATCAPGAQNASVPHPLLATSRPPALCLPLTHPGVAAIQPQSSSSTATC